LEEEEVGYRSDDGRPPAKPDGERT
jgi:hypothetical protein